MTPALQLGMFARARVRLVRQSEMAECGLASLTMVANFHGLDVDLGAMRRRFRPSSRGASLRSVMESADRLGLTARAVKLPLDKLGDLVLPAILHWDMNHFVVLEAVKGGKALIHDPAGQTRWRKLDEVSDYFTGVALELRPADDFEPRSLRERLRLPQLWRRITGLKRALVQTVILSIVMQAFVLASPYYMQVAVDDALPALDHQLLTVLALGFGLFTLVNAGASFLRSFVLLSAGTSLGFGIAANVARRLFRLPVTWFERRHVGDVLSRFQSIAPIRQFLTEGAIAALVDGSLAVFTLGLMAFYSPVLTLVALAAFALYAILRLILFAAQRAAQEEAIAASGREQSLMIETLRGITTLRLFNRETARHAQWQIKLADSMNASAALARITAWQSAGNALITGLEMIVSVWLAIGLVIDGGFSTGMVFAFMAYKSQFLQKGASLIDQAVSFRLLGLHLERLSDIALAEQDVSFDGERRSGARLDGRIELRDIRYRYGPNDPLILDNLDLSVAPGEHIAITGPSGGGKSTLLKILLGLVQPDEGQVLIDGVDIERFGYKNFHEQIGAVLQDDQLFAGSLAENIALFAVAVYLDRGQEAAAAAALLEDIAAMPLGFDTMVGDMGSSLSGGQKQRLLLARAIYRQPRILIMDEGTSHLDPQREQAVNQAVANLGITRIVVAHRLETILSAKRVYGMTNGRLSEITDSLNAVRANMSAYAAA